jgi:DNA polymerase-3 subunit beta
MSAAWTATVGAVQLKTAAGLAFKAQGHGTDANQLGVELAPQENGLRLRTWDRAFLGAETTLPGDASVGAPVRVPAKSLQELAQTLRPGPVTLTATKEGLEVAAGGCEYRVRYLGVGDALDWPAEEFGGGSIFLETEAFRSAAEWMNRFASADETRPILTGMLLEAAPDALTMMATDTYRLGKTTLPIIHTAEEPIESVDVEGRRPRMIVSRDFWKLFRAAPLGPTVRLEWGSRCARLTTGNVVLVTRLIEGEFPNYQKVIPSDQPKRLVIRVDYLREVLGQVAPVAEHDSRRTVLRVSAASVNPKTGRASEGPRMTAEASEWGRVAVTLDPERCLLTLPHDPEIRSDDLEIAFNNTYLREALAGGNGEVTLRFSGALNPLTVQWHDPAERLCVVMPMQIIA